MSLGRRLLNAIYFFLSAIFSIPVKLIYVVLAILIVLGATYGYTNYKMLKNVGGEEDYDEAMRYIEIKDVVQDRYIDDADRVVMGSNAAAAMISGLGDRWSYYMSADEYRAYLLNSSDEYSGLGMSIVDANGDGFQVVSVNMDSPAAWAGLTQGMVITSVDGTDVRGKTIDQTRKLIRSKMNDKFVLGIGNGKEQIEVDCKAVYTSSVKCRLEKTLAGYVQIKNFEAGTAQDAINGIEELFNQGAIALCIDLRGNSGGLDSELATFLDYLLPSGTLFIESRKSGKDIVIESDSMCIQMPMCVLVNGETFGEAEVCAAALQERGWATVLGEATTGKTRTQETIELSDGSAIRLSTGTYLTANGKDISASGGIVPEYIIHNSDASATGTTDGTTGKSDGTGATSNDEQLMQALKLLS